MTIITSIPVIYCCVSNHLKTRLRQRFLCPGLCLADFSWVVLNSFEITLMAPGRGWAPARIPGRPQYMQAFWAVLSFMGSLQQNSRAPFYDPPGTKEWTWKLPDLEGLSPGQVHHLCCSTVLVKAPQGNKPNSRGGESDSTLREAIKQFVHDSQSTRT